MGEIIKKVYTYYLLYCIYYSLLYCIFYYLFYYAAAKNWNALPTLLIAISSRIIFRNRFEATFSDKL